MKPTNVIAISYAKHALEPGSREHARMQQYAQLLTSYHVIVFTRHSEGFPVEQHIGPLHLYATNARTKIGMLCQSYRIGRRIAKQQPDTSFVVSSQDPFETSLVGRAIARARNVSHHVQIHGDVFNPASYRSSVLQRVRVWYGTFVVRHATALRVVSARIKRSVVALGVAGERVTVLPVQADLTSLLAVGANREHTHTSPLRLLFLGRLALEKQLPLLLAAVAAVREQGVACTLEIVGTGPQASRVAQVVQQYQLQNIVTSTPWTDDIAAVMKRADVLCLTSAHEGWGMVLLEAAAAKLAIVTTDVGCVGESLVPGQSVLVARTASEFTAAIVSLQATQYRADMASSAYAAATQFTQTTGTYQQSWAAVYGEIS